MAGRATAGWRNGSYVSLGSTYRVDTDQSFLLRLSGDSGLPTCLSTWVGASQPPVALGVEGGCGIRYASRLMLAE